MANKKYKGFLTKRNRMMKKNNSGFTLIEVLIALAIVSISLGALISISYGCKYTSPFSYKDAKYFLKRELRISKLLMVRN